MRTSLNIDLELMKLVKKHAAETRQTITAVIEDAIRQTLLPSNSREAAPFEWTTVRGRVLDGVDLRDRDKLFDLMEGRG